MRLRVRFCMVEQESASSSNSIVRIITRLTRQATLVLIFQLCND
jgi:hypothetical protein